MRKVIQIAVTQDTEDQYGQLFALADDGSIWILDLDGKDTQWGRVPNLPQDAILGDIPARQARG